MSTITVNANKVSRSINVNQPACIEAKNLQEVSELLDEDVLYKLVHNGLKVAFRSIIRTKLESLTDDEPTYSDEEILELDFSDWVPEARTRMSAEEKAMKALGSLDPEQLAAVLAAAKAQENEAA